MKHLKLFFACLLMAVLSIGQVWATDVEVISTLNPSSSITLNATATEVNQLHDGTAVKADFIKLHNITADANELNILDGATLSTTELNYVDGVTSSIQTQLDNKRTKISKLL